MRFGCAALLLATLVAVGLSQTTTSLNLATQTRNVDFSNFPSTKPASVGATLPSTCQLGQIFFNTAAPAGANILGCSQQNTWSVIGGYTLPPAGPSTLGGVTVPSGSSGLTVSGSGSLSANVGTIAGTVAAGNDPRIVNALQPTSQIPIANVTGLARSATIDATNASNISTGTLGSGLLPATISSSTTGNAATAAAFSTTPTGCPANQYATGISANGNAKCAQVGYSQVSGTPTLYNQKLQVGGTAQTQRANVNFAAGPNVTITPSDNGTNTTTLTLSASPGVSGVSATSPITSSGGSTPAISCPTCVTGSSSFTNYALVVGEGALALGALPSTGSTTQVLHGNSSGLPAWGPVNLATDVTGQLSNASVSGLSASATTDTTNAANISSGTLNSARLPMPSALTLGGVESYVAVPHQWINSISTAGAPSSSQPAFSDLSGSVGASQLPALTGDTTTSAGSTMTTTAKVNGTSVPNNSSPDQTIVTTAAATGSWASLPACLDSGGNHLNYNPTTHSFLCGNTGGTIGSAAFGGLSGGTNTQAAMLVGTGASLAPTGSGTITANNYSGTLSASSLPAPTASTLGGVESYSAPAHQWINAISTAGVPSSSQPAASDIAGLAASATTDTTNAANISSGTLSAARLPNPSASTLGGIESYAAAPHQWINSISTAGVPSAAQPAFGDISGSLGASQLPALTGDTTTAAGSTVTTTSKVNGTSVPANSSSDQTIVTTAPATGSWASLPTCLDSSGNHLNYNATTHSFSCGTTSSGSGSGVPTITASTTGKHLNNNGTSPSWSAPVLDCSQFAGSDMSIKIQACLVALASMNGQGGIADARNFVGSQTWSVNPFAASNISRSGVLLLPPIQISTYVPIVIPNFWSMEGAILRGYITQSGTSIQANGAQFHAWANPDLGYVTAVTANGGGVTVTGSGTAFSSSMIGCALVAGSAITMGNVSAAGFIASVASSTSLTINWNTAGGSVSGVSLPYAIYCPVVVMGNGDTSAGYQFGIGLRNIDVDCNSISGCVGVANWFSEEHTEVDHVEIHGFTNIGLDIETAYAQNSGPYQNLTVSASTSCSPGTLNLVDRVNGGSVRSISGWTSVGPSTGCSGSQQTVNMDVESPGQIIRDIHFENTGTGIQLGGTLTCPIACPQSHLVAHAAILQNINGGGASGTTVVSIAPGQDNIVLEGIYRNTTWTNVLVDGGNNNCSVTSPYLGFYALANNGATKYSTSTTQCTAP